MAATGSTFSLPTPGKRCGGIWVGPTTKKGRATYPVGVLAAGVPSWGARMRRWRIPTFSRMDFNDYPGRRKNCKHFFPIRDGMFEIFIFGATYQPRAQASARLRSRLVGRDNSDPKRILQILLDYSCVTLLLFSIPYCRRFCCDGAVSFFQRREKPSMARHLLRKSVHSGLTSLLAAAPFSSRSRKGFPKKASRPRFRAAVPGAAGGPHPLVGVDFRHDSQ